MRDADAPSSASGRGPLGLGWPALAAGLLGALFLFAPRGPTGSGVLGRFLSRGPADGMWEIRSFTGTRRYVVLCDPEDDRCCLVGCVGEDGCDCGCLRTVPREQAAEAFVPGCYRRFLANYRVAETREVSTEEGVQRLLVWRPRAKGRGETARRVWIDPAAGRLLRVEDRAVGGDVIRDVRRLGDAPIEAPPAAGRGDATRACLDRRASLDRHPPSLGSVDREAPFGVLEPTWLPRGFGLREATYRGQEEGGGIACVVYGDGLATVALFMGPVESVRRFEKRFGRPSGAPAAAAAAAEEAQGETCRARRHRNPRRTVLKVDDLHGLSVVLLGRNELAEGDYLRILEGLQPASR